MPKIKVLDTEKLSKPSLGFYISRLELQKPRLEIHIPKFGFDEKYLSIICFLRDKILKGKEHNTER